MSLTLVIGGTRSGKSAHAERLARGAVRYIATADGADPERIARHRARRPPDWEVVEAGDDLASLIGARMGTESTTGGRSPGAAADPAGEDGAVGERADPPAGRALADCVLLDGLGVWIAGVLHRAGAFAEPGRVPAAAVTVWRGVEALLSAPELIVVAEEAGSGLLPTDAASRAWLDLLGEATQRLAERADAVVHVVAGIATTLRGTPVVAPGLRHHGDRDVRPGDADHAVNVVAGGPPAWLRPALDAALRGVDRYPDESAAEAALAALHGRDPAGVIATNGAAEALWLLGPALRPRLAACVHPAFTESEAGLRAHGVPVVQVLRDAGFALDPAAVPEAADLVVLGNPASPSGTLAPAAGVLALRRPGRILVVDEAFMSLVPGEPGSLAGAELDDVIVVRSLTKVLSIPGLRAGYALASPPLADRLRAARPPWSVNALALAALEAAAAHPGELAAVAERAAADRADLARRLAGIDGVRVWPGTANFCLVEVADGPSVVGGLRAQRIAVRPAASFPGLGPGHLRITARDPGANARLAAALAGAIGVAA